LIRKIFEKVFGENLTVRIMGQGYDKHIKPDSSWTTNDFNIILRMLQNPQKSYFLDQVGGKDLILKTTLESSLEYLKKTCGNDMKMWKYGSVHLLTHPHPFGERVPAFNRGPYPVGGDGDTPNNMSYTADSYHVGFIPSFRGFFDLGDLEKKSSWILPIGNCGVLGTFHYDDQVQEYLANQFRPIWSSDDLVSKHTKSTLKLSSL
jgi:penicillin amidase